MGGRVRDCVGPTARVNGAFSKGGLGRSLRVFVDGRFNQLVWRLLASDDILNVFYGLGGEALLSGLLGYPRRHVLDK